jgi:hypothetical protein
LVIKVCTTTASASVAMEKNTPRRRKVRYPVPSPTRPASTPLTTIIAGRGKVGTSLCNATVE